MIVLANTVVMFKFYVTLTKSYIGKSLLFIKYRYDYNQIKYGTYVNLKFV